MKNYKILIVGSGSIGRRHASNLRSLHYENLAICDPDRERLEPIAAKLDIPSFANYEIALAEFEPQIVCICTPPVLHVEQALTAVKHDAHLFIEKPLSHQLDQTTALVELAKHSNKVVHVGYNYRFDEGLNRIKTLLEQQAIGRILWARAEMGQYLPDWRPWQDYRQSYTARKELGGGIILDSSHEINYMLWLLGDPNAVLCMAGTVSNLDVNVEDCATLIIRFKSGSQADIHLDFIQRVPSRSCKFVGETGTIEWDETKQSIWVKRPDQTQVIEYDVDSNQPYLAEMVHFMKCVEEQNTSLENLETALQTLRVALAAHSSADLKREVNL